MAELTGKDTPAPDPKSSGKTGPVKPPVLEGTTRPTSASPAPDSGAAAKPSTKPAAVSATASNTPRSSNGSGWVGGLVGGALGLGAAYGLAWFGLWPQPAVAPPPADPRLAQFATTIPELETVTATVQDELSVLTRRVATLETAEPPTLTAPLGANDSAVTEQLEALASRIDTLASRSSEPDSGALAALEAELTALRDQVAAAQSELTQAKQQIAAFSETADASASADASALRLPLIFSGLEDAFASGRPFETELAALRQALPELLIPETVSGRATTGLPRPDVVQGTLTAALPDMLAGRPIDSDAGWQGATVDWFRGLVAMRPSGAVEGNSPDAVIARLEAAIAARDFVAAKSELEALPDTMQAGAQQVRPDIESLAGAQAFLAQLRQQALSGGSNT